ncbi:MAG TPA: vWA domain-containing protein [Bdellovibrionales bacterium]|nr:vWA domain-containing protein [Bdellovibrionales bacterium]
MRNYGRLFVLLGVLLFSFQNCAPVDFASQAEKASRTPAGDVAGDPDIVDDDGGTGPPNVAVPQPPPVTEDELLPPVVPPGPTCSEELTQQTVLTKIFFVVDISGSNQPHTLYPPGLPQVDHPGSDPARTWRLKVVKDMMDAYRNVSKVQFGISTFSSSAWAYNFATRNLYDVFSRTPSEADSLYGRYYPFSDGGGTFYTEAFRLLNKVIKEDPDFAGGVSKYIVVFLSDGRPQDYNINFSDPNSLNGSPLFDDVRSIVNIAPSRVTLNTVFYHHQNHPDPIASQLMKKMAEAGNGGYVDASSNRILKVDNLIKIPNVVCQ